MKRFIPERWPWLEEARGMRSQLLDILSNADLSFHTTFALSKSSHKTRYPCRCIRIVQKTGILPSITFLQICRSQFIQHSRISRHTISLGLDRRVPLQ